ncbi:pre-B-cell leukemia homeobox interacting protein 1b isoform 2-T2 [Pholidichthys leucotaenia]
MSGSSSANNSWTIVTPEETIAETLKPETMGTEYHEESQSPTPGSGENSPPVNGAESAKGLPVENSLVSDEKDSCSYQPSSAPTTVTDNPVPSCSDVPGNLIHGSDKVSQAEGLPKSVTDPNSFSDSDTHIPPSHDDPSIPLLRTETLGGEAVTQEEEMLTEEGASHLPNREELQQEGEESGQYPRATDLGKEAAPETHLESEVGEEKPEKTEEPNVRRRRSFLASLEQIGRREEDEEVEEEFQLPQREDDSGFSVNKCILGALILLGLGTIFFSESDYGTTDLKDVDMSGKQDFLNPEIPLGDADNSELINKLAKGNQQVSVLEAQLQAQKEELKVVQGQAAKGAKERLWWEEVEKENSRLKMEMESLPVLQKENEKMKKELESLPALQKELETLRSTVIELKLSSANAQVSAEHTTLPSNGQPEDSKQDAVGSTEKQERKPWHDHKEKKKDLKWNKHDKAEKNERKKSDWIEGEQKKHKDVVKNEWKKEKHVHAKPDKQKHYEGKQKRNGDETKQGKVKDWKKENAGRGDEGKPWKDKEGNKKRVQKMEKKEWREEKDEVKVSHEKASEGKQWKGKEENKNRKAGKAYGEKEWKKMKDGFKEGGKEKWEEEKKGRKNSEWKNRNGKNQGKGWTERSDGKQWEQCNNRDEERSRKDERKQWNENGWKSNSGKQGKEWKRKDEKREQWKEKEELWKESAGRDEKRPSRDRKQARSSSHNNKGVHKFTSSHGHRDEHLYGDGNPPHTHHKPLVGQPEYWVLQRNRLQHKPKPPQQCNSLEACAKAEWLLPVSFPEFEAILQTYLAKTEEAGVDESKRSEFKKLVTEFFKDGVFVHDQMSFRDYVEDVGDILEDLVEGDENGEEDSAIEDEMEEFEKEVLKKFMMPGAGGKEEWRKASRRG